MGTLEGRVAIVTGAGHGLGREHALLLAREGAKVVVNDLGGSPDGHGADAGPAQAVVREIAASGGEAVADTGDVADWEDTRRLVETAVEAFGDLHVLVNNAGILRERMVWNMSEEEFDAVVRVHLKGHFCPTRHATAWWRAQAKAGRELKACIINTASMSGLAAHPGHTAYTAAKAAIAQLTIQWALELGRLGVRVNSLAPYGRTRMGEVQRMTTDLVRPPDDPKAFDPWDAANVSPLVAYLAAEDCPLNGTVFHAFGGQVGYFNGWSFGEVLERDGRWTIADLRTELSRWAGMGADGIGSRRISTAQVNAPVVEAIRARGEEVPPLLA